MTPTLVQKAENDTQATTLVLTLPSEPSEGNVVFLAVSNRAFGAVDVPPGFDRAAMSDDGGIAGCHLFYRPVEAGDPDTYTVTATVVITGIIFEYAGVAPVLDRSTTADGAGANDNELALGPTADLSGDVALGIALVGLNASSGTVTGWTGGYATEETVTALLVGTQVITDGAAQSTTPAWTNNRRHSGLLAVFKAKPDTDPPPALPEGWEPADLAWDLLLDAEGVTAESGERVQWPDVSGNSRDATNATAGGRPHWVAGVLNGRPMVRFAGDTLTAVLGSIPQPWSLFLVGTVNGPDDDAAGLFGTTDGTYRLGSLVDIDRSPAVRTVVAIIDGADSVLRVDGYPNEGDTGSTDALTSLTLGPLRGSFAMIGVKAGAFTDTEAAYLEQYATAHWGLDGYRFDQRDGWSWWTRPRAVAHGGTVYTAAISNRGEITVDAYDGQAQPVAPRTVLSQTQDGDDHSNGSIVLVPGRKPVTFFARHNEENYLRCQVGLNDFVPGQPVGPFAPVQTIASPAGSTSYSQAHVHGDDLYVWTRILNQAWGIAKTADWGGTFGPLTTVFRSTAYKLYMATVLTGDTMRCALAAHPADAGSHDIFYAEIDLTTGAITVPGNPTPLGNLDGTNLPLDWDTLQSVATPTNTSWIYDVSDGPDPELVWADFSIIDAEGTSKYTYARLVEGTWNIHDIVDHAGDRFSDTGSQYLGAAQFPRSTDGGVVYTCREDDGQWYAERQITTDGGATWTPTILVEPPPGIPAVRAWPIEDDGTSPFEIAYHEITHWVTFEDFDGRIALAGPTEPAPPETPSVPSVVSYELNSTRHTVTLA